ncbi:MAG: ribose-phosphate pyrophosphokinase [Candidatus Zixiibacteriota bacterium]|nr:MAG: ribose-phosphate pyrophosphokinase [candidate division Zixibacteria bacterium]
MNTDDLMIFSGSGSKRLTDRICNYLGVAMAKGEVIHFSEGNTFVRVLENVRGRRVYLVQSTVFPANDNFMELLFWIDAFKRASAEAVTVIIPYFSYAKGDKKDEPRVSIRARVCADAIEVAGADRVVTMDLHSPQVQGFFRVPVDNLYALPTLCDFFKEKNIENIVVVSPDSGFAKHARKFAAYLKAPVAIADKQRVAHDEHAEVLEVVGNVRGKTAVVVDDFTISCGTLIDIAAKLVDRGAKKVYALISHGVFAEGTMEKIDSSLLEKILVTDTVENQPVVLSSKIEIVSVASVFAMAIRCIHNRESISAMFP